MTWTPDQPTIDLPESIRGFYVEEADFLYQDLRANRLEVILVPAPEPKHCGHMIRAVANRNPDWYRELYSTHSHFRRDLSLRALDRIRMQKDRPFRINPFKYDAIYRGLIHDRLIEGHMVENYVENPNNTVRNHFGMDILEPEPFESHRFY